MAHWVRGRIAEREKETAVAEQEFRAAVTASQGGARAWLNLAGFYRHADRFDEMEQALHSMESSRLDHPAAFVDGASMLFRAGRDYPLAIQLLRSYLGVFQHGRGSPGLQSPLLYSANCLRNRATAPAAPKSIAAALSMAHSFRPAQDGLKRVAR